MSGIISAVSYRPGTSSNAANAVIVNLPDLLFLLENLKINFGALVGAWRGGVGESRTVLNLPDSSPSELKQRAVRKIVADLLSQESCVSISLSSLAHSDRALHT